MLKFRQVTVGELEAFVNSAEFRMMEALPISVRRGVSQAHNPRAKPDDIALFLAFSEQQLCAYLGVLPDTAVLENEQAVHCGWLSCLWVSPTSRGCGLAQKLLGQALEAYNGNITMTEFTPEAQALYQKLGYQVMSEKKGLRCYLRPNLTQWFSSRKPKIAPLFRLLDGALGAINSIRLGWKAQSIGKVQFEKTNILDEQCLTFLEKNTKEGIFRRTQQEIEWVLRYPWLASAPTKDEMAAKYYFTSVVKHFECFAVKLLDENQRVSGLLIVTLRDGTLKIPYLWITNEQTASAASALERLAWDLGADRLIVYHPLLVEYWTKQKGPFWAIRPTERGYMASSKMAALLEQITPEMIQDGDGDAAFT